MKKKREDRRDIVRKFAAPVAKKRRRARRAISIYRRLRNARTK